MAQPHSPLHSDRSRLVIAVAALAAALKILIALATFGTNDVVAFYEFAKAIEAHGLAWTYEHSILFNHPPLVGYLLRGLIWLSRQPALEQLGISFPFLLRLPGIIADFLVSSYCSFSGENIRSSARLPGPCSFSRPVRSRS